MTCIGCVRFQLIKELWWIVVIQLYRGGRAAIPAWIQRPVGKWVSHLNCVYFDISLRKLCVKVLDTTGNTSGDCRKLIWRYFGSWVGSTNSLWLFLANRCSTKSFPRNCQNFIWTKPKIKKHSSEFTQNTWREDQKNRNDDADAHDFPNFQLWLGFFQWLFFYLHTSRKIHWKSQKRRSYVCIHVNLALYACHYPSRIVAEQWWPHNNLLNGIEYIAWIAPNNSFLWSRVLWFFCICLSTDLYCM